eukprot:1025760-Rhodomonas_salina.1
MRTPHLSLSLSLFLSLLLSAPSPVSSGVFSRSLLFLVAACADRGRGRDAREDNQRASGPARWREEQ